MVDLVSFGSVPHLLILTLFTTQSRVEKCMTPSTASPATGAARRPLRTTSPAQTKAAGRGSGCQPLSGGSNNLRSPMTLFATFYPSGTLFYDLTHSIPPESCPFIHPLNCVFGCYSPTVRTASATATVRTPPRPTRADAGSAPSAGGHVAEAVSTAATAVPAGRR